MKKGDVKKTSKNILSSVFKIGFSIIFGFLPSFIFISLFVQYGSPFSNYTKFLSDLNSSLGAWLSAVVIGFFAYFIIWVIKTRKNFEKRIKNKKFLVIVLFCFVVALSLIAMQLYLYLNFVAGNDVLIRLSADKNDIFFTNGLDEEVNIKISVIMNPFCSAQCEYELFDISTGQTVEEGNFNIYAVLSKHKSYTFEKDRLIRGQILNRFEVRCKSKKTILCYTSEQESERSLLITLNYELSGEEEELKDETREQLIKFGEEVLSTEKILDISQTNINSINNLFAEDFSSQRDALSESSSESSQYFKDLENLWYAQDFSDFINKLNDSENKIEENYLKSEQLNSYIISNISFYNNLIDEMEDSKNILLYISQMDIPGSLCSELNLLILEFNELVQKFNAELELSEKKIIIGDFPSTVAEFYEDIQNIDASEIASACSSQKISDEVLAKIDAIYFNQTEIIFTLDSLPSKCCFLGECGDCCDEGCSGENYPIIFLHGHSINKALPVDYSFDSFSGIKEELVNEGYIDAGAMIISSDEDEPGLWGKLNVSVMVTASYFFDAYQQENGIKIVSSNSDSLDTYAIRLREIVDLIKYRTNKDKVILVAQSGGGLVARRYIQIFGADEVDKIILITVPNHGIDEKTKGYCMLFGPEAACNDMDEESIFINKLNSEETDDVSTYNIIGVGCEMDDETGDGIIKNSSQYLDYATNYYVEGECNELSFEFFHEYIIYPEDYPEVYRIVKDILKED